MNTDEIVDPSLQILSLKPMRRLIRQPLAWMATAVVVVCLLWPRLSKDDRFPYTGVWEGNTTTAPGYKSRLQFIEEGGCAYTFITPRGSNPNDCSYEMRGGKAFITHITMRGTSTLVFHTSVASEDNGKTLLYSPVDVTMFDKGGEQVGHKQFTEPAYTLYRIR